ncbi:hypothetical protein QFC24_002483 [Naganishia onofrii]|uniref:Uncharacterized protein n=1 Tax=Naganishia onofrii TaxID=1851511 RepID=A0ACC2XS67_9TREE|nr:hypothetical protein QFC24_002483 [Naganishia onofrii]
MGRLISREMWQRHQAVVSHLNAEIHYLNALSSGSTNFNDTSVSTIQPPPGHVSLGAPRLEAEGVEGLLTEGDEPNGEGEPALGEEDDSEPQEPQPQRGSTVNRTATENQLFDFIDEFTGEIPDSIPDVLFLPLVSVSQRPQARTTFLQ